MGLREINDEILRIVEETKQGVVTVITETPHISLFYGYTPIRNVGSGFAVDKNFVVTNAHVVRNATRVNVVAWNGDVDTAEVVASDPSRDLALLSTTMSLKPLKLGDSDKIRAGEIVLALGSPLGLPGLSVTLGVISATGRTFVGQDIILEDLIQTDAAINPGNSGGPIINLEGEAIGVATAVIPYAQGIGFAIPISTVKRFLHVLSKYGRVVRAWIGVYVAEVDKRVASIYRLPVSEGLLIVKVVPGSPAYYAELYEGDVIVRVNGKPVRKTKELREAIEDNIDRGFVELEIARRGKKFSINVPIAVEELD